MGEKPSLFLLTLHEFSMKISSRFFIKTTNNNIHTTLLISLVGRMTIFKRRLTQIIVPFFFKSVFLYSILFLIFITSCILVYMLCILVGFT